MRLFSVVSPNQLRALPFKTVSLTPLCMAIAFGFGGFHAAQANIANLTANLELISLQGDEVSIEGEALINNGADVSDVESISDDDIDAIADDSVINDDTGIDPLMDDADFEDTTVPLEVSQVPLKAISPDTLKTFVAVVDLVRREYVEPVNDETLFNNAMSGMLTKLDSHAEFLDGEAFENLRAFTEGDVGDVGLKAAYEPKAGFWVVNDVIEDSPADKKGIAAGDYLHQIGEFKLDESRETNDIEQLLTGIAGTQVDVVISKAGRRKRAITLQRNNTHMQTIQTRVVDGIAVIKLPAFQNNSRDSIMQSLTELDTSVTGVLLDVRDNPGGVLTSAVNVASLFMDNTDVVQVKSRHSAPKVLTTQRSAILKPLPVVILQNRYSASAAEVLASSLQAQNRAIIAGEVSYGKGSVQSVLPLNDEQAVKLTVAHYLTAKGAPIDKIGVTPDVSLNGSESTWEAQALDILRKKTQSTAGIRFVKKNSEDDPNVQKVED